MHKADRLRALFDLAREQHAVVARAQLVALGFSRHQIAQLVAAGQMSAVHRGVYALGPARLTRHGRWLAAVLACGHGAVLSHRSAAALWGLVRSDGCDVEILCPRQLRGRPGIWPRHARLGADEIATIDGIPVTSVSRTTLDLAGVASRETVERALHEIDLRRLLDAASIGALVERHPNHRAVGTVKAILADHLEAPTRNRFEAQFLAFVCARGLPRPLVNHPLAGIGECDVVWPQPRLIVELDGYAAHGTRRGFEADRARDRALAVAGWRVIRITWRQLRDDPERIAADLGALLGSPCR